MSNLLVFGSKGLVGSHVMQAAARAGWEVLGLDRAACDVSDAAQVLRAFDAHAPTAVVNASAYTNVDGAEDQRDAAYAANVEGPRHLAALAAARGVYLVHYSTDFAFGEDSAHARSETEPPSPVGVYSQSKVEGEKQVMLSCPSAAIARVGNVYGRGGRNFAAKLRGLLLEGATLSLDAEREMSPTSARAIAAQTLVLLGARPGGLLHMTCAGRTTWFGFAKAMAAALGIADAKLIPKSRAELAYRVPRPSVVLARDALARLGLDQMPTWEAALSDYLASEAE